MAIGDIAKIKMSQGALSATVTAKVTASSGYQYIVKEIWLVNSGTTDRIVSLYAHGSATANLLATIKVLASDCVILSDCAIVLDAAQVLYMKQDTGTDVTATIYGYTEATA
jgi:hypothetical protein